jgi:fructose-1,6-bisphosphatase/inositol monophosphatase family enzyme
MTLSGPDPTLPTYNFVWRIAAQIVEAARDLIVPRFRSPYGLIDVRAKSGGELVSEVDLLMQHRLTEILGAALPESLMLSEETADPRAAFDRNRSAEALWIVDPLDGTTAFLGGESTFGVAVALYLRGAPAAGWLYAPMDERLAFGGASDGGWWRSSSVVRGGGYIGQRRRRNGVIASGDFPSGYRARVESLAERLFDSRGTASCVVDYLDLLSGQVDFLLYRRTLPWDHAAGVLLAGLAGGGAIRFDHGAFDVGNWNSGLLVFRKTAFLSGFMLLLPNTAEQDAPRGRTAR